MIDLYEVTLSRRIETDTSEKIGSFSDEDNLSQRSTWEILLVFLSSFVPFVVCSFRRLSASMLLCMPPILTLNPLYQRIIHVSNLLVMSTESQGTCALASLRCFQFSIPPSCNVAGVLLNGKEIVTGKMIQFRGRSIPIKGVDIICSELQICAIHIFNRENAIS